jgi:hypothetical protein
LSASFPRFWRKLRHSGKPSGQYWFFWVFFLSILAASVHSGQLSITSLVILLCFVVVVKVAMVPLSQEYLTRYHFYVKAMRWLLGFMAASALASWILGPFGLGRFTPLLYQALTTVITLGWTLFVMVFLFSATRVERNTLFAGLAVYLLLAASWAELFELLQMLQPGSFEPPLTTRGTSASLFDIDSLYLSLSSITTVGIAKIEPIRPAARCMVTFESTVGNLYLAVMIARLVALHKLPVPAPLAPVPALCRLDKPRSALVKQAARLRRRAR